MFSFINFINNLLSPDLKERDSNKDVNGKGTLERFVSIFEDELNSEFKPKIEAFTDQLNPIKVDQKLVTTLAYTLGSPPDIFTLSDIDKASPEYKRLLSFIIQIYKVKGTLLSFQYLFGFLGYNVLIVEYNVDDLLYDSDLRYDETPPHLYDSFCEPCSFYSLLYYSLQDDCSTYSYNPVDPDDVEKFDKVIPFLEPINAVLRDKVWAHPICEDVTLSVTESVHIIHIILNLFDDTLNYDDGIDADDGTITIDITI